jgi:hypothetical protein
MTRSNARGTGHWWDLLDPTVTRFNFDNNPEPFGDSLEDAAGDTFHQLIPSEDLCLSFNEQHHDLLTIDNER